MKRFCSVPAAAKWSSFLSPYTFPCLSPSLRVHVPWSLAASRLQPWRPCAAVSAQGLLTAFGDTQGVGHALHSHAVGRRGDIGVKSGAPRTVCGHSKRELQPNKSFPFPVAAVPDWPPSDFSDEFFFPFLNFSLWFERQENGTDF